ncbi:hypothetical protein SAMN04488587_0180 [Methanococcoides vulcani]|uniref:Uncharacterized protein n=1 Tax=Methanococcoides vulcani TaxID=1353158 RepID=A0A1H9Y3W8_9EURY|nr:hypothetical protein [Methanococcoides vulcani]SES63052.1 hypothetical protein SAMN04488587_0180 [Methanococcoides vulcani]
MNDKQKEGMRVLMREVGVEDNEEAVKIAKIGVGIGLVGLIFGLAAIGMVLQSNGLVEEVVDTIVLMGDVQNNHVNLTMQDNQRIDRLEEEVFEKEESLIKITNDTIEYYDLEYLVVRENMSGNVMIFGDFNADGSHVEWDSSVMYSVLEDTNESITIRMEK